MRSERHSGNGGGTIRVLVVDDHPVVRDGYRRLLESTGEMTVVAEAETGETGYEAFKEHRPDVVIMDLTMPGAGGLDAIRRITQWDPMARVLVFSMHESPIFQRKSSEAGAIGYLSKRCAPKDMLESVRQVAQGKRCMGFDETTGQGNTDDSVSLDQLTLREFEVFNLLALGHPVHDVARILNISQNTAGVHQTRIMNKLGLQNAAQLARLAIQHGVVKV